MVAFTKTEDGFPTTPMSMRLCIDDVLCEGCDGVGVVGSPPDAYMPCPDCTGTDLTHDRTDDRTGVDTQENRS